MFLRKQKSCIVIDIGSRWIKCARYAIGQGTVAPTGSRIIDIQEEGLLSPEEISEAIRRVVSEAGGGPVALVLPQGMAVSQVIDLPDLSAGGAEKAFEDEILELIGLRAERCVHDSTALEPYGGFGERQWITVAKEDSLARRLSPLLGQGLQIEAATTVGNALLAAFQYTQPQVSEACLVDIGATQTTVVCLQGGQPTQMTSLVDGGENWTEALLESGGAIFEEMEVRLFRDDLFDEPAIGPALRAAVRAWRERVLQEIEECFPAPAMAAGGAPREVPIYLYGGYSGVKGLRGALNTSGGARWQFSEGVSAPVSAPVWASAHGGALMASGVHRHQASILPNALVKMRLRRRNAGHFKMAVVYLFMVLSIFLMGAVFKQRGHLKSLEGANRQARSTLSEIEASAELLQQRDALAKRIEPIVVGQSNSIHCLETFQTILRVQRDFEFTLIRFSDQDSYFRGIDDSAESDASLAVEWRARPSRERTQAYVLELMVQGGQAERLQILGDIVGRLRQENYFSNVDRLVGDPALASGRGALDGNTEAYALLLTLAQEPVSPYRKESSDE